MKSNNPHYKFPDIEQLRHVLLNLKHKYQNPQPVSDERKWIFDESISLPTLNFIGTVKLHGTNAAIVFEPANGERGFLYSQSRDRVLTLKDDNNGFCAFLHRINEDRFINCIPNSLIQRAKDLDVPIVIYGEWCGKGIQSKVAISQLDKMFVVFSVKIGDYWCYPSEFKTLSSPADRIFNIFDYPVFSTQISFNNIADAQISELEKLTELVETECPVAKAMGISGLGEGIVWTCYEEFIDNNPICFKTKGEKHKNVKESKLIQMSVEKASGIEDFVEKTVTEDRLNQGFETLKSKNIELSKKSTGEFVKWVQGDIEKENKDILAESGLEMKDVSGEIQKRSREWFFKRIG